MPMPFWFTTPAAPLIALATTRALLRLKLSVALFSTAPLPSTPVEPPPTVAPPTCRMPVVIVVVV